MTFAYSDYRRIQSLHSYSAVPRQMMRGPIIDKRRSFAGFVEHDGDYFDYVVDCEINDRGMTWFATVYRGAEIRGNPNGILDGVELEHPELARVLDDVVGKSMRDRVGVRV